MWCKDYFPKQIVMPGYRNLRGECSPRFIIRTLTNKAGHTPAHQPFSRKLRRPGVLLRAPEPSIRPCTTACAQVSLATVFFMIYTPLDVGSSWRQIMMCKITMIPLAHGFWVICLYHGKCLGPLFDALLSINYPKLCDMVLIDLGAWWTMRRKFKPPGSYCLRNV